jgi:signal transduction histidine kinase
MVDRARTLHELLKDERQELIDRWSERTRAALGGGLLSPAELLDHVPSFVDELVAALFPEALPLPGRSPHAVEHGAQRLRLGFDVGEVVREYGILHLTIIDLAAEAELAIGFAEQEVVGRWINGAIADAVSQYVAQRDAELGRQASEHIGFIAHELRNPLSAARLALIRLRSRELAGGGAVVELLERNLQRAADVVDSTLTHAWLKMGVTPRPERVPVRPFLDEVRQDAEGEAERRGIRVEMSVEPALVLEADPRLLRSAVANLLLNAIKFSAPSTTVSVKAHRVDDGRVCIEVADSCGGLPPGRADELFTPMIQRGRDRSGFGLGLAIALQAAEAHRGTIKVRDVPGHGCVFVVDLPGPSKEDVGR